MPLYRNIEDISPHFLRIPSVYIGKIRFPCVTPALLNHLDYVQTLPYEPYVIRFKCERRLSVEMPVHTFSILIADKDIRVMWWTVAHSYVRGRDPLFVVGLRSIGIEDLVKGTVY